MTADTGVGAARGLKWESAITKGELKLQLGTFGDEDSAARAYDYASKSELLLRPTVYWAMDILKSRW